AAGFQPGSRAFFIWEGVTNYLSEEAVNRTLRFVASTLPGNRIVFTYVHKDVLTDLNSRGNLRGVARTLQKAGEPWTFGFDPIELPVYLHERGLRLLEDIGSVEYPSRYMGSSPRVLNGYEFYRIAVAEVIATR
ncbi:MAG TPA: class I SAM-dependent methyltransferase, partial [Blastocatellia bacterium]|nr:class I SAM-dependent methyltransferase [Blastocatellia bacterium]